MNKEGLRRRMSAIRDGLTEEEKQTLDERIRRLFTEWDLYREASALFCYVSFRSEIDTAPLIDGALREGKVVAVPRVDGATRRMGAYVISSRERDLEPGHYGILEPVSSCRELSHGELDLILVPGLAFTRSGHRLGYGGGYYDRFLQHVEGKTPSCSLAYERLVLDRLPLKNYDIPVDYVITESGIIATGGY
jgi:5-formyltetrahydrofolate cyclo-ligase